MPSPSRPDDALLLERGAERLEVDVLSDDSAALQLLHPLHRLLHVAAETRDEVEEELQQLFVRQERLEEVERQLAVPVVHAVMLRQVAGSPPMLSSVAMQEPPSGDVISRMRGDWDRRAEEDHKLHIATGHAGSEETFRASGAQDLDAIVLDGVVLDPSAEILEIGCGVGRLLVPLAERVAVAHGVDISPVMIEKSKEYAADAPNVKTALTDGSLAHLRE